MGNIVGNDISEHQGVVNWPVYKGNTNFVIIRATIGTARADAQFKTNQAKARELGVPLGYYHYSYPQYNSPESEAEYFCAILSDIRPGELMVLDFEENWSGNHVDFCKRFLDKVKALKNGYKPLIYLNESQVNGMDWSPVVNGGYGLWIAKYAVPRSPDAKFATGKWPFAAMYQWTSEQKVPGINGNVDGDVFYGDVATLKKYGIPQPNNPPPPPDQTVTIPKAEYDKLKSDNEALIRANQQLTASLAQAGSECQVKLTTQHDAIIKKVVDLASTL